MKAPANGRSTLRSFLAIAATWIALAAIALLASSWFVRSAEAELVHVRQNLDQTAMQTIGREYQRYGLLLNELDGLSHGPPLDAAASRAYLERTMRVWGPSGTVPNLLQACGRGALDDGAIRLDLWLDAGGRGYPRPADGRIPLSRNSYIRLDAGDAVFQLLPSDQDFNLALVVPSGVDKRGFLVFALGGRNFFRSWVLPALAAAIPDAAIQLDGGDGGLAELPEQPRFNPVAILFGYRYSEHYRIELPLPRFTDFFRGAGPPPPGGMAGRFMFMARNDRLRPQERREGLYIAFKPGAGLDHSASRLAITWLGAMALLGGLGVAFSLVVAQIARLSETRMREREFVAAVTHELRTPLTVIRSCADNLAGGIVAGPRVAEYGGLIGEQAMRLGRMVEDVLDFAGVSGRAPRPAPVDCDLPALLAELRRGLDPLAAARGCRIDWPTQGVPSTVRSDPGTLNLALGNLVANAIHHAYDAGGPIRVSVRRGRGRRLEFLVEDEGRGIPPREAAKIFKAFYRGSASRRNQELGAGLGLHLASRKAALVGGAIRLESPYRLPDGRRQGGCRFIFSVPGAEEQP